MEINKIKEFKEKLQYVPIWVKLKTGDVVKGRLANNSFENRIIEDSGIPLPLTGDYICLVNLESSRASYLLVSEIESISLDR